MHAHPVERPLCYECQKPIFHGEYIQAEGFYFHTEHFTCYKCSRPLQEGYVMVQNHAYCQRDYAEYFRPKCFHCDQSIPGRGIVAELNGVQRHYHPDCFRCKICDTIIREDYSLDHEGNTICFRCPRETNDPQDTSQKVESEWT